MDKRFASALGWILQAEGGYVNDPADPGGETKYGISKRQYPDVDIPNLTIEQAGEIYQRDYWQHYFCDSLPVPLDVALFDAVVNMRADVAVRLLQQALKVKADGLIGPVTLRAASHAPGKTLDRFLTLRAEFYVDLVTADSSRAKFRHGWLKRLFHLHRFLIEEHT